MLRFFKRGESVFLRFSDENEARLFHFLCLEDNPAFQGFVCLDGYMNGIQIQFSELPDS
jgi:hypothetical protein